MGNKIILFVIICITLTINAELFADILNVPDDFETIQAAIDESVDGDTVLVSPGTYVENINFNGKAIVVGSLILTTGDEAYIDSTVIDGDSSGSVVIFENGESEDAILTGFTIQNGSGTSFGYFELKGGGICIIQSDVVIEHCKICDNHVIDIYGDPSGGGIICYGRGGSPTIRDCEIYSNSSEGNGGGITIFECNPTIERTVIRDNSARSSGGIFISSRCNVTIRYCAIFDNTAESRGGGIGAYAFSTVNLQNVTIAGNSCKRYGGGILCVNGVQINVINSIFWANNPEGIYFGDESDPCSFMICYCDIEGGEEGIVTNDNGDVHWLDGNIEENPQFVDPDEGDFHLAADSPCIDAGTAFFVWEDDTLVNMSEDEYHGEAPDMGAYESNFSGVDVDILEIPTEFKLYQNYPNPFNSTTTITYSLPVTSLVSLQLYNIAGRNIKTLVKGNMQAGVHLTILNGGDLPSGLYFVRLEGSEQVFTSKIMLIR
ncbi:MAG: T9SS type A sorting domain-containing protein [Calditrichaeota bacterium]|nr:T9SS type A sorting domain-containing protein [Calditrichota bacterium]